MIEKAEPLLIGSERDFHLSTVKALLTERGADPVVIDADGIADGEFSIGLGEMEYRQRLVKTSVGTGWLRRLAYAPLASRNLVGSIEERSFRARARLIGSICRLPGRQWLTALDHLQAAEDKLLQLWFAQKIGIATPPTVVASDSERIVDALGADVVLKPLGGGMFLGRDGEWYATFTSSLTDQISDEGDFAVAPFIAQRRIEARTHLRVVTMLDVCSVAELHAADYSLDWRIDEEAHSSWVCSSNRAVSRLALALADALGIRYSSQDWIVDPEGSLWFLDLNPAGQWLFLPDEVAMPITERLVSFLITGF